MFCGPFYFKVTQDSIVVVILPYISLYNMFLDVWCEIAWFKISVILLFRFIY